MPLKVSVLVELEQDSDDWKVGEGVRYNLTVHKNGELKKEGNANEVWQAASVLLRALYYHADRDTLAEMLLDLFRKEGMFREQTQPTVPEVRLPPSGGPDACGPAQAGGGEEQAGA